MITILCKHIPFKGFSAFNFFGILVARKDVWNKKGAEVRREIVRHEAIHTRQMIELAFVFFYIIYFFEWAWKALRWGAKEGYRRVSFEVEAYAHEKDDCYLSTRKHFAQWRH